MSRTANEPYLRRHPPPDDAQVKLASGLNIVLGLWLIIAPFVLQDAAPQAYWNDVIVGVVVAALALARFFAVYRAAWLSWINVVLGAWLIIAPFALNYVTTRAHWNDVIVGLAIAILGAWSALGYRWRSEYRAVG